MNWIEFLNSRGARSPDPAALHFGDAAGELAAARSGSVLAPLPHLGVLEFSGEDARAFLNGQLSCDVENLAAGRSTPGCYCTPKGRVLANFLLWGEAGVWRLALARELVPAIRKRLQTYVLRSRVSITDTGEALALFGVSGPDGERALVAALGAAPARSQDVSAHPRATVVRVSGDRFLVVAPRAAAEALWDALASVLRPVGPAAWQWLDIANGLPLITTPTQEQFVPQMVNLELLGAVSFRKGCYPGQEVVARAQHLGQVKRRMFLAHVAGHAPAAGDAVIAGDAKGQAEGMIVNAAPSPDGGYDALVVLQTAGVGAGDARLRAPDGPRLEFRRLPYADQ